MRIKKIKDPDISPRDASLSDVTFLKQSFESTVSIVSSAQYLGSIMQR